MIPFCRYIAASIALIAGSLHLVAQGGWIRPSGEVFAKAGISTLSTETLYTEFATGVTMPRYTLTTLTGYVEGGIGNNMMIIADMQLLRINQFDGFGATAGVGDMTIGLRYGLFGGDWPVSIGVAADLPTGDPAAQAAPVGVAATALMPAPRGDGELNVWVSAGVSHSFWPIEAYVSADAGYSLRGIATRDYVRAYNDGRFTNQYRVSVKGGYKVLPNTWTSLALYQVGNVGSIQPQSFTALGFGEGVAFTAWDLGVAYEMEDVTLSLNGSTAFFVPRNIYGGMQIIFGIAMMLGRE